MPHETPNLSRIYAWFGALVSEDFALMQSMLDQRLPVDILHPLRQTSALMEAVRLGRLNSVKWLIAHGASPMLLCGSPMGTPTHCALQRRHWEIASLLVEAMDDCAMVDGHGSTLLHRLCMQPLTHEEVATAKALALKLIEKLCLLDVLDQEGTTALHHCVVNGQAELAALLLTKGADPNAQIPGSAVSPLTIAALEKNMEMAKLLLDFGADPHVRTRDGTTAVALYPPVAQLVTESRLPR